MTAPAPIQYLKGTAQPRTCAFCGDLVEGASSVILDPRTGTTHFFCAPEPDEIDGGTSCYLQWLRAAA